MLESFASARPQLEGTISHGWEERFEQYKTSQLGHRGTGGQAARGTQVVVPDEVWYDEGLALQSSPPSLQVVSQELG